MPIQVELFRYALPIANPDLRLGCYARCWADPPSCDLTAYRAQPGIRAQVAGEILQLSWDGARGQEFRASFSGLLHAGENTVRVVVANLAINLLAKGPLPDYKALNAKYGERFQAQDMANLQPLPSGLLGPVRLIAR